MDKGFTRAELLVSLAIVAAVVLGGLALRPTIIRTTGEARATRYAKLVAQGLRLFSFDHAGSFPDVARNPSHALLRQGIDREKRPVETGRDTATENFSTLIGGGYYNVERVYHLDGEYHAAGKFCPPPDQDAATPLLPENVAWAYVRGLDNSTADAATPLIMTRNENSGSELRWPRKPGQVGGVLADKIVVATVDGAVQLLALDHEGVARDALGRDITAPAAGTPYSYDEQKGILQP